MTGRASTSLLCATALLVAGCTQTVGGTAVRPVPGIDEDSRSPVDVDGVLLDRSQMQAITGAGVDLTPIPGTDSKVPVDLSMPDFFLKNIPQQCHWAYDETQIFGPDVEEFRKESYQNPPGGGIISQGAAGYRDTATARGVFDDVVAQIQECGTTRSSGATVGEITATPDSIHTRTGNCGRDYRVKSAVLVEVTFCAFPDSVPDIVVTNIVANIPD
ncbi:sensor domain-containing protein [Mycobacterium sp. 236(2023)]|uniref:sensor domain-containing protein n=1 Tax=Mycobacterium sp. 236(2023) TaxID=3038163 RepID=UPI002414EFDA|nr:sensor domain-containing protein [Mycobacterium sp. 236(2023)]MDG4664725.1 sensor domain-containing protein [Mycobacterium sp. 236(2023)]